MWNEEKQAHVHPVTGRRVDHISGDYTFETDEENESVHSVEEDESLLFILADGEGLHGRNPCATERGIFSSEDENVDVEECPPNPSCELESSSDESDLEDEFVDWPLQADQFARNASVQQRCGSCKQQCCVSSESFDRTFAQSANLRAMPSTSASAPAATTTTTAGSSTQASTSAECFESFRCDVCGEMSSQLGCLKADYRRKHEWGSDPDYRYYSDKVCYSCWQDSATTVPDPPHLFQYDTEKTCLCHPKSDSATCSKVSFGQMTNAQLAQSARLASESTGDAARHEQGIYKEARMRTILAKLELDAASIDMLGSGPLNS